MDEIAAVAPGKGQVCQLFLKGLERTGGRKLPFLGVKMHPVAFAFHIIDLRGVQPPQAALHRHSQIVPGAAAELFLGLLQLL